ncbi:MAG: hypothetical protein JOZ37_17065 [Actinobacteria bacterium]|nr:hypothetical protein [Actinomycetota bacterium]MBV9665678.1 hypothetical protein [Actinomycetota bacterium]MBV9935095.1 hypothetical protein [Actinomycetota bacterium]
MRRLFVVTTLSLLVLVPAACGSSGSTDLAKTIADAPAKTAAAGSAKLEATVVQTKTSSAPSTTARGSATTTSTVPSAPTKITGAVDFKTGRGRFDVAAASLGLPAGSGPLEAILVGQVYYLKGLAGLSLPGKPWIKIDLTKLANGGGVGAQLQSLDPNSYLVQLRGLSGAVHQAGKETVRGEKTTHYTFTVDLDKAAQLAPANRKSAIEAAAKTVANKSIPTEVWLDGKGRVRRFKQSVVLTSGVTSGTTNLTLEYFDFGTKVDATAPSAGETADFTQLLGGSAGG